MEGTVPVLLATKDGSLELPPGFRFHPTDEEIITNYLLEKAVNKSFSARAVGEVDLNKNEPWELPGKAKMGEKEWYFFCQRDKKYPTGTRTNRATEKGYWKATGKDKEIHKGRSANCLVGMKKTLVFYMGRAPKGEKTNWVMHEYRLDGGSFYRNLPKSVKDAWVVCRVFHKNDAGAKKPMSPVSTEPATTSSDQLFEAKPSFHGDYLAAASPCLPYLMESPNYCSSSMAGSSFMDDGGDIGGDLKPEPPFSPSTFLQLPSMGSFQDLQSCFLDNNFLPFPDFDQLPAQANVLQRPPQDQPAFYPQAAAFSPPNMGYPPHAAQQDQGENAAAAATATTRWQLRNVEQHANRPMIPAPSQDTTPGAARNAEISSDVLVPNPGGGSRSTHGGVGSRPSSSGPHAAPYPEAFWKY